MKFHMGLDIGSTTVKLVIINEHFDLIYSVYQRHFSDVTKTVHQILEESYRKFNYERVTVNVTGSGALSIHES